MGPANTALTAQALPWTSRRMHHHWQLTWLVRFRARGLWTPIDLDRTWTLSEPLSVLVVVVTVIICQIVTIIIVIAIVILYRRAEKDWHWGLNPTHEPGLLSFFYGSKHDDWQSEQACQGPGADFSIQCICSHLKVFSNNRPFAITDTHVKHGPETHTAGWTEWMSLYL